MRVFIHSRGGEFGAWTESQVSRALRDHRPDIVKAYVQEQADYVVWDGCGTPPEVVASNQTRVVTMDELWPEFGPTFWCMAGAHKDPNRFRMPASYERYRADAMTPRPTTTAPTLFTHPTHSSTLTRPSPPPPPRRPPLPHHVPHPHATTYPPSHPQARSHAPSRYSYGDETRADVRVPKQRHVHWSADVRSSTGELGEDGEHDDEEDDGDESERSEQSELSHRSEDDESELPDWLETKLTFAKARDRPDLMEHWSAQAKLKVTAKMRRDPRTWHTALTQTKREFLDKQKRSEAKALKESRKKRRPKHHWTREKITNNLTRAELVGLGQMAGVKDAKTWEVEKLRSHLRSLKRSLSRQFRRET